MEGEPADSSVIGAARQAPDHAIEGVSDDRLRRRPFMEAIASVADAESTTAPYNIAVSAPWGSGKSSVLNGVEEILEQRPPTAARARTVVARFDAWHHDDAADIKADLYQCVLRCAAPARGVRDRIMNPVSRRLLGLPPTAAVVIGALRHAFVVAAILTLVYAFLALIVLQTDGVQLIADLVSWSWNSASGLASQAASATAAYATIVGAIALAGARWVSERSSPLHSLSRKVPVVQSHRLSDLRHSLHEILNQIRGGRRLVLLVENLDRCKPENIRAVLEALRQVLDSRNLVAVAAIDQAVVLERLQHLEGWDTKAGRGLLNKTFDLRVDLPLVPSTMLPNALYDNAPEDDAMATKMTPTNRLVDALVLFFAPSYWAWRRDSGGKIEGVSDNPVKDFVATMLLVVIFPVFFLHESRDKVLRSYPLAFRDQEASLGWRHFALSAVPLAITAAVVGITFLWVGSGGSGRGAAMLASLFAVLFVHGTVISICASRLYAYDDAQLADWRENLATGADSPSGKALPPRLRGARAKATKAEIDWSNRLNNSPGIRQLQRQILKGLVITPREYKQWTNRLRVTLAMSQVTAVLPSEEHLNLWSQWTLMQELSPDLTEAAARALFGADDDSRLQQAIGILPAGLRLAWGRDGGAEANLEGLLFYIQDTSVNQASRADVSLLKAPP